MNSDQIIAVSILAAKEGKEIPNFSALDTEVSKLIVSLIRSYDYTKSREFRLRSEGRSDNFRQRLTQTVLLPGKLKELKGSFLQSIREIESSDRIFDFLPVEDSESVVNIRRLLARAGNS